MRWAAVFLSVTLAWMPGLEAHARGHRLRHAMIGRRAVARAAAGAAFGQWRHSPRQWGGGAGGLARRFGSSFGQHGVKTLLERGIGHFRHEYPGYTPSHRKGFGPRMKYVVSHTFLVPRAGHRKRSLSAARLSGAFGSGLISRLWQPAATRTLSSGLAAGGVALGLDLAGNTAREFYPRRGARQWPKESLRRARRSR